MLRRGLEAIRYEFEPRTWRATRAVWVVRSRVLRRLLTELSDRVV